MNAERLERFNRQLDWDYMQRLRQQLEWARNRPFAFGRPDPYVQTLERNLKEVQQRLSRPQRSA